MDKVIRDGKVAVLYSPGYGAGWFSCNSEHPACLFDPDIVEAVLANDRGKARDLATQKFGAGFYAGGARDLKVKWIPEGTKFEIEEYEGNESIHIIGDRDYLIA